MFPTELGLPDAEVHYHVVLTAQGLQFPFLLLLLFSCLHPGNLHLLPTAGRADSYTNRKYSLNYVVTEPFNTNSCQQISKTRSGQGPCDLNFENIATSDTLERREERKGEEKERRERGRGEGEGEGEGKKRGRGREIDHNSVHEACKHLEFLVGSLEPAYGLPYEISILL